MNTKTNGSGGKVLTSSKWNPVEKRDPVIHGHSIALLMQEQKMQCSICGTREFMIIKANGEIRADCVKCRANIANIEIKVRGT